ncbi:hypothetical protein M1843_13350 [Isoptericola sp. 4D.3]|uniref:Uncharacterized protein n=1 Tax=Isoptericola peretonis TaxID=2918523 RepID=A0ABT0J5F9_9MICO|nr:hypothetical protein [Isoptericola sp. 4D.3]
MTSSPRTSAPGDPGDATRSDAPRPDEQETPARAHLSLTQVVASALAAVSATVLMSFFGVAGTIIGAGLASVVTVIGNFFYTRSIEKTHEQLKPVVTKVVARTGPAAGRSRTASMRVAGTATTARGTVVSTSDAASLDGDDDATSPSAPLDATQQLGVTRPLHSGGPDDGSARAAGDGTADPAGDQADSDPDLTGEEEPEPRNAWLRFVERHGTKKVLAMSAAALFVVVMGVVLVIEMVIGKPLSDAVRGQEGSGTSISRTSTDSDGTDTVPSPTSPAEDPANVPGDDSGGDVEEQPTTGTTDAPTDAPSDAPTDAPTEGTDTPTDGSTDDTTGDGSTGDTGGSGDDADTGGTSGDTDDGTTGDTGSGADTGSGLSDPDAEQDGGSAQQDPAATPTPTPAS